MTTHDDSRITDWLAGGEGHGRGAALDAALAAARSTNQRPAWMVSLTGGTFAEPRGTVLLRRGIVALVTCLLVGGLLVGGLAAGGVLPLHLPQQPVPSAAAIAPSATDRPSSVRPDGSPSTAPSSAPPTGLVAYLVVDCTPTVGIARCTSHPWLAAADGRDAHVLEGTSVVGWSADGSRLVLENVNDVGGAVSLLVADPTGAVVATIEVPCVVPRERRQEHRGRRGHQCPDTGGFALFADGTRVAFTRSDPNVDNSSVLSVLDLATGRSTVLDGDAHHQPHAADVCNTSTRTRTCQGFDGSPRWSPDGRSIAFERQLMAPERGAAWDSAAVFVVDADGSNLRRVTPSSVHAIGPAWSPGRHPPRLRRVRHGRQRRRDQRRRHQGRHLHDRRGRAAGWPGSPTTGSRALPDWTTAGRLAFIRDAAPTTSEHWIMDADGGNQGRLGGSLADLTAAGCTTCVYVAHEPVRGGLPRAYWRPLP